MNIFLYTVHYNVVMHEFTCRIVKKILFLVIILYNYIEFFFI